MSGKEVLRDSSYAVLVGAASPDELIAVLSRPNELQSPATSSFYYKGRDVESR